MHATFTRRSVLATAAVGVVGTAGCLGSGTDPDDDPADADEPDPDLRINGRFLSSAFPVEFVDPSFEERSGFGGDARIAYVHWHGEGISHWHQSPLELDAGETRAGTTRFLLEGADAIPLGPGETFSQAVEPTAGPSAERLATTVDGSHVEITAMESADAPAEDPLEAELEFELRADGESRWTAPPLPVEIS